MNKCKKTGNSVRLRVMRVSFNRKKGLVHWIEYIDGTRPEGDWESSMFKPYPKRGEQPQEIMMKRWDAENMIPIELTV